MAALVFDDLTLGYDRHPAVHHLSGRVEAGALLAVCGPNGAGKSTLLKGIMGQIRPLGGAIRREDDAARDIAYLPQAAEIDRSFPVSVLDFAAMGLIGRRGLFGGIARADEPRIGAALAAVGLSGFEARAIGTLSGGQMQRLLFARLMLQEARLILLDEPFTAIDASTTEDLLALVEGWNRQGRTVVAVLHDFDLVRRHFPQTLLLAREPVAWGATAETLSAANLAAARRMIEAFDAAAHECERAA
jgi:zinc/manganese transport system ATP-binding protein